MSDLAIQPVVCVIGHPIAGNPMQFAIERALAAADLDWRFLSLDVPAQQLRDALRGIDALGFVGASIAAPHGGPAARLAISLTPPAAAAQWIDCLCRDAQGLLTGYNLLGHCLAEAAQIETMADDRLPDPTAVLVGDSDAAIAACAPLLCRPLKRWLVTHVDLSVWDAGAAARDSWAATAPAVGEPSAAGGEDRPATSAAAPDPARPPAPASVPADGPGGPAERPGVPAAGAATRATAAGDKPAGVAVRRARSIDEAITDQTRLIVRASMPDGRPAEIPEALLDRLSPPALVVDLAVASSTSPLARAAQQRGLRGLNRLDLLVAQAAAALQLWTGQAADGNVLREAFEEYLEI